MDNAVERVQFPSEAEFAKRYLKPGKPVLIEGLVNTWPAADKWTAEFFYQNWADRDVPIAMLHDGNYAKAELINMPLGEYLQRIGATNPADTTGSSFSDANVSDASHESKNRYYLAQVSLEQNFPELLEDISIPEFFRSETAGSTFLYAGGTPFSQLHYHPFGSATLSVLSGAKRVRLFAPDQGRYLYPHSMLSGKPHFSLTHHKDPDPEEFPEFSKAKFIEITVMPGEMLFFPMYYWHSIENIGFSISATTFWSRGWISRFIPPPGPRGPYFLEPGFRLLHFGKKVIRKIGRVSGLK